jgi:hypothetical protein
MLLFNGKLKDTDSGKESVSFFVALHINNYSGGPILVFMVLIRQIKQSQ